MAKVKVQMTIDEDLLAKVDAYADDHYITRSGFFSLAADEFLSALEFREMMPIFTGALQKAVEGKEISQDDQKKLEAFQAMSDMFMGKLK